MRLTFIIILILVSSQLHLLSQISFVQDTITGTNSQTISIEFEIDELNSGQAIEFDILIANPTMLYIIGVEDNPQISSSNVTALGDGLFTINISAKANMSEFRLEGKLLTGNDSVTTIYVQNLVMGDDELPMDSAIIKNTNADKSGLYIRFFESRPPIPNPLFSGETTTIDFYNDLATDIEFIVSDVRGFVYKTEQKFYEKGMNQYNVNTTDYPAGSYYVFIFTDVGNTSEQIVVIK